MINHSIQEYMLKEDQVMLIRTKDWVQYVIELNLMLEESIRIGRKRTDLVMILILDYEYMIIYWVVEWECNNNLNEHL